MCKWMTCCAWAAFLLVFGQAAHAQSSLASRVLVVYAANDSDSSSLATYYQAKRAVPNSNICPVTLPNPAATVLSTSEYLNAVKTPVRNCLNAAGAGNILYIVLTYIRPFVVDPGSGLRFYALDSYLADIWDRYATRAFNPAPTGPHRYYADNQSQGESYIPFQSLADYRADARNALIYSVWRLDAATPALAKGLVDKALAAEAAGGPISQVPGSKANACIDLIGDVTGYPDSGLQTGNWDLLRAKQALTAANNFNMIFDTLGTTFGNAPSPNCPNTGLYAGWYNYGTYNNAFSWDPGAIGWDLNSGSLADPRGGGWWGPNALLNGITVTSGPVAEPYLTGLARPLVIRNLLEGANVGDAFLRNTRWLKWHILNVGDPLYLPFPNKVPPFNTVSVGNSLTLNRREVLGGRLLLSGTVTVSAPASGGGLAVNLSTDNPAAVTVPASVTIPSGTTSVTFPITTSAVVANTDAQITASFSNLTVTNTLSVYTLLGGLGFAQTQVKGGAAVAAGIGLNDSAPLGGATVQLTSDQPNVVAVPASIAIPAGLSQAGFTITTAAVSANTTVKITAAYGGAMVTSTLTVTP